MSGKFIVAFFMCVLLHLGTSKSSDFLRNKFYDQCTGSPICVRDSFKCYEAIDDMFEDLHEDGREVDRCLELNGLTATYAAYIDEHDMWREGLYRNFMDVLEEDEPEKAKAQRCCTMELEGMLTGDEFQVFRLKQEAFRELDDRDEYTLLNQLTSAIDSCPAPVDCKVTEYMKCLMDGCMIA